MNFNNYRKQLETTPLKLFEVNGDKCSITICFKGKDVTAHSKYSGDKTRCSNRILGEVAEYKIRIEYCKEQIIENNNFYNETMKNFKYDDLKHKEKETLKKIKRFNKKCYEYKSALEKTLMFHKKNFFCE